MRPNRAVLLLVLLAACAGPQRSGTGPAAAGPDRSQVPESGSPPALRVPPQEHFRLSNGLAVRLVEYHRLPVVALNLVIGAGGALDPADRPGLASFTASMVTEGTARRSATRISDDLGALGAQLGALAGFDSAQVIGTTLSRNLEKLLEIAADVVVEPSFPPADFARVQDERLVTLVQQRDVPQAVAGKAFAEVFWSGHPYGHWMIGNEASVKATRREELARFHQEYWRPGNAELVVVGDVSRAELVPMLERTLARWKEGPSARRVKAAPPAAIRRTVLVEKPGAPQALLMMGMPGLDRASEDFPAAEVTFQILGGGSASRLFRHLREEHGYTYGIYARADARKLGGSSLVLGSVKADVTGAALKDLLADIETLRHDPVSPAELADGKNAISLELPASFVTAAGIAGKLADEVVYGLPDDYWDRFVEAIGKVSTADVRRVAQKYLALDRLTTVMVGPASALQPQLAGLPLGPVEVRQAPAK